MKNTIFYYLSLLMLFTIGCSTSNKSVVKQHQEKNYKIALMNLKKGKSVKKNQKLLINAIKHKDFIRIKDKFEKIGTLPIIDEFKTVGTLGYEDSYKRYDELYSNLDQQIKIFEYKKILIKMVLEE
ncbi:MAG: hypothetical protein AB8G11_01745 [Saprospiraceae bacterium]